jgi:RHS repeat-associated protein
LQVATTYEVRGMAQTITSRDSATQNSGTVLNQVKLTYNTFGQVASDSQAHAGTVASSGTPSVGYAYDSGGSSSNEIWPVDTVYPSGRTLRRTNGTSGVAYGRATALTDVGVASLLTVSAMLGSGLITRMATYTDDTYTWLDLWGGTSGTLAGLDLFNRVTDQRWKNGATITSATDLDRYQYGYDRNSNRLWKANMVATAASQKLDELYSYDNLNRLVDVQRGTLNSGKTAITSGTGTFEQTWSLDPTGNWGTFQEDSNGIGSFNLVQNRTSNTVNEITNVTNTTGGSWASVAYDPAGNMRTFPQPATPGSSYTAVYDAWNRMVSVSASGSTVATYAYDGRNYRIVKTESGTTTHAYYNENWQLLEEQDGSGTMTYQYTWGLRYIDELVMRYDAAASANMFALQDANYNVTAITDGDGTVQERYTYTPYGTRTILTATWGSRSTSSYFWVVGHQGLFLDGTGLIYNRRRMFHCIVGSFIQRDHAEYIDSPNLYLYLEGGPLGRLDPTGLLWCELKCGILVAKTVIAMTACFLTIGSCAGGVLPACAGILPTCCSALTGLISVADTCGSCDGKSPIPPELAILNEVLSTVCDAISSFGAVAIILRALKLPLPPVPRC